MVFEGILNHSRLILALRWGLLCMVICTTVGFFGVKTGEFEVEAGEFGVEAGEFEVEAKGSFGFGVEGTASLVFVPNVPVTTTTWL